MKSSAWSLGASVAALAFSMPAAAQTAAPQTTTTQTDTSASDDSSPDGDIVITAQRRSENLMTTAVSASVLTGTALANKGVPNVDALQFAMPSVVVNNFGQGNDFNVRGIGKAEHNTQTTTGVITYRDGVPTFPGYLQMEPYFDVANVQVLRGPQVTLVGQNATGGAVFVNTNDPVINGGVHGYFNANYGNYNDFGFQGAINIPRTNTLAMRLAMYADRRDSFFHITGPGGTAYPYDNGKMGYLAGRVSLLWKPSDRFSALWKTDLDYLDSGAYPASPFWQHSSFNPAYRRDLYNIELNAPQDARDKFVRSILKLEYDTAGGVKFRSVTGYSTGSTMYRADLDGYGSNYPDPSTVNPVTNPFGTTKNWSFYDNVRERQFSQEFNIISPDNQRFSWLVGGFGMWNTYTFPAPFSKFTIDVCYPITTYNPCLYQLYGRNPERNLAAFGQVGVQITPSLKVEVGGRYTSSRSTNNVHVPQYGALINQVQTVSSDNFSYKASLGWKASADQYLYGFVATGFRPGGLNVPVSAAAIQPFKPEKVTSFEAGWKSNWAGGPVRTTITGFYNDYNNFQVIIGYPTFPTFGIELNVPNKTKIYGFEGEIEANIGGLKLGAGVNVLHSELGTFYAGDPRNPPSGIAPDFILPCDLATGPASAKCIALGGRRQTYAPNVTFNVSGEYTFTLPGGDSITPSDNFGYVGSQWATLFESASRGDLLEARKILNAQISYTHGTLSLTAYATNLTDQHYVAARNSGLYFAGAPRQYGLKVLKVF